MAKWFCLIDGKQVGPIEAVKLKQLADAGTLRPQHKVRREDLQEWYEARQVTGLFAPDQPKAATIPPHVGTTTKPSSTPNADSAAEPLHTSGNSEPQSTNSKTVATTADQIKGAARLASKQAALKTLQLTGLFNANLAVGTKAFANSVGLKRFGDLFKSIHSLDHEVAEKRVAVSIDANETLADRTKRLAREAKKRVEVERLLQKRKKLLAELGQSIRESDLHSTEAFKEEVMHAQATAAKASALENEIAELTASTPSWMRPKRILGAVAVASVLLAVMWGAKKFLTVSPERKLQKEIAQRAEAAVAEKAQIEQEMRVASERRVEETKERQAQLELERTRRQQKQQEEELKTQKEEEERKLQRAEEETQRKEQEEGRRVQREQNAKEMVLARQREDADRRSKAEAQGRQAQIDRRQLAESLFSEISLDANMVHLSKSARQAGATVEIRGSDYAKIRKLHDGKDWLAIINYLNKSTHSELPDADSIQSAARRLLDTQFFVLVKTSRPVRALDTTSPLLWLIHLQVEVDDTVPILARETSDWEAHPDGIGYMCRWRPADGESVLVVGDWQRFGSFLQAQNNDLRGRKEALKAKRALGELDDETARDEYRAAINKARDEIAKRLLAL